MLPRMAHLLKMQPPIAANRGLLHASGATVPTDGTDGYQTGCDFKHTDGGNNTSFYINEGSVTSCEFNAVTTGGPADILTIGAFSSVTAGSGIPISSTQTGAVKVYSDDVGVNINSSVRGFLSRFLLTIDQTGGSIRALMGQLKFANLIDVMTGVYTANQGYVELAGTSIAKGYAHLSCFDASLEIGSSLTVNQYGKVAGIYIETTGTGTITVDSGGLMAGVVVTKASGAASWPIGVLISGADVIQGINVGSFSSTDASVLGVTVTSAITAANRFYTDDGATAIVNTGVNDTRGVLSRLLARGDHTANPLRLFALEGQLKGYCASSGGAAKWNNEMVAGVYGYMELERASGTMTLGGYGFTAGVMSCVENSGVVTVNTNHVLSGFCAVSKITSDLTATGKTAAFHAAIYDGTNWSSSAEDETAWEYGLFVAGGSVSVAGVQIGSDGSSAGDLIVYSEGSGSYMQYDEDANTNTGRLILANSTFRQTQNRSLNECAMAIYLKYDSPGTDTGNARTLILNCDVDAGVTLTEDSAGGMVGLESSCRIEGTLNGAGLDIFGITGQLYGSPEANTLVNKMAAIHAANQCTIAPATGSMYLFEGVNHAAIVLDAALKLTHEDGAGTFTVGIDLDPGTGTITTAIDIGTCATAGVDFTGSMDATVGLRFTNATFIPEGNRDNRAIELGSRGSEIELDFQGTGGVENFEPIQMNFDCIGTNPASTSTVNIWQGGMFLDRYDLGNVRLKWSDLLTTVNYDCKDVYIHQAEIAFGNLACAVGNEVAVLGLVLNAGTGGLTCNEVHGVTLTLRGTGIPSATSDGYFLHVVDNITVTNGFWVKATGTVTTGLRMSAAGSGSLTNAFAFPAEGTNPTVTSGGAVGTHGTKTVAIRILIDTTAYYLLASTIPTYSG